MSARVAIVDDQAMVRMGFALILEAAGMEVVAQAGTGREGVAAVSAHAPDVVLMDVQMPDMDGIEATAEIVRRFPAARVVILTTFERDDYLFSALRAGASGFLLKNCPPEDLVNAVRVVAAGEALLAPSVTRRVIAGLSGGPPARELVDRLSHLTAREREVLRLMAEGHSNAELAERLYVSEGTVKTHVSHLLGKLALRDRVQAVVFAYESGLVVPGQSLSHGRDGNPPTA